MPLTNVNGEIQSTVVIYSKTDDDGKFKKCYEKGTKKTGAFCVLGVSGVVAPGAEFKGELAKADAFVLAEGYATAKSVEQNLAGITDKKVAVIAVGDSGNLFPVGETLKAEFPGKALVIAGDNDFSAKFNAGKNKAEKAAQELGAKAVFPSFDNVPDASGKGLSDFNDIACNANETEIKAAFANIAMTVDAAIREQPVEAAKDAEQAAGREVEKAQVQEAEKEVKQEAVKDAEQERGAGIEM